MTTRKEKKARAKLAKIVFGKTDKPKSRKKKRKSNYLFASYVEQDLSLDRLGSKKKGGYKYPNVRKIK